MITHTLKGGAATIVEKITCGNEIRNLRPLVGLNQLETLYISAGTYQSKSRAAYWDGRNQTGETVASGVYFYTLTAGGFTATRKLLIRK